MYNSPNHQYCSEKCRIEAWEQRTGKSLEKLKNQSLKIWNLR